MRGVLKVDLVTSIRGLIHTARNKLRHGPPVTIALLAMGGLFTPTCFCIDKINEWVESLNGKLCIVSN